MKTKLKEVMKYLFEGPFSFINWYFLGFLSGVILMTFVKTIIFLVRFIIIR